MPDIKFLVCKPTASEGYVVPGSLPAKCSKCGQPVWVAPSSWLLRQDNPGMEVLCMPCSFSQMEKAERFKIEDINQAQAEEIKEYLKQGGKE